MNLIADGLRGDHVRADAAGIRGLVLEGDFDLLHERAAFVEEPFCVRREIRLRAVPGAALGRGELQISGKLAAFMLADQGLAGQDACGNDESDGGDDQNSFHDCLLRSAR